jgi:aldehyde dehydrogenase (NAD+)
VQKNLQMLVSCESINSGRTSRETKDIDVTSVIKTLYYYAGSSGISDLKLDYEPVGLVAVCGFYDSSLLSLVSKVAPALASGNVCLIVPHRLTPLSAYMFLDLCVESGLPAGVINLVLSGEI